MYIVVCYFENLKFDSYAFSTKVDAIVFAEDMFKKRYIKQVKVFNKNMNIIKELLRR